MIELPVFDKNGKEVDRIQIDEALLGGRIRPVLLKQALVMYHANARQASARTRNRSRVAGSTRKLYRQKGTGNARVGNIRTVVRRGGGVAFAKTRESFRQRMPQKQRRLARNSAILAKLKSNDALVIDELAFDQPKTSQFVAILKNLNIDRSCLVTTPRFDENTYKSLRNVPRVSMLDAAQLNAGDILRHRTLLFTRNALQEVLAPTQHTGAASQEER